MNQLVATLASTMIAALAVLGSVEKAFGQQEPAKPLDVTAPAPTPPTRELGLQPAMPFEQQGAREQEFYPGYEVRTLHDPAFVTPFVGTVATSSTSGVRAGFSGWTAPALPYDSPQEAGGVAFGLTFMWSVPVVPKTAPVPEVPRQR